MIERGEDNDCGKTTYSIAAEFKLLIRNLLVLKRKQQASGFTKYKRYNLGP